MNPSGSSRKTAKKKRAARESDRKVPPRKSEENYHAVLDHLPDSVLVHREGIILYINPAMIEIMGIRPDDVLKRPFLDYILPDYHTRVTAAISERTETGRDPPYEIEIVLPDGERRTVIIHGSVIEFDGSPANLNVFTDITGHKRAEEALKESEQRNAAMISAMPDLLFVLSRDGTYLDFHVADTHLLAIPREQILGKNIFDPDFDSDAAKVISRGIAAALETGTLQQVEYRLAVPAGMSWFEARLVRLSADRVLGIVRDITRHRQAEEALRESEEKYRTLIEKANEAVIIAQDGNFAFANPSMSRLLGVPVHDLIGKPFIDFIWPEDRDLVTTRYRERMAGEETPDTYDFRVIGPEGRMKWVFISGARILWQGKLATLNLITDITGRRVAEDLRKATELRLDSAMEIGSLAWWEMDMPSGTVRFDARKATMLGYQPEQFRHYADFTALLHPDDFEPAMQAMRNHLEGRADRYQIDYRIRMASGEYLWFRDVGRITHRHPDGTPGTLTGIVVDITAAKKAEETVRESRQVFIDIISFLPDPTFVIDRDGRVLAWNRALEQLSGIPAGEIIGKGDHEYSIWMYGKRRPLLIDLVLHPDQDSARLNSVRIHRDGQIVTAEAEIVRDGSTRRIPLSLVASPLLDAQGKITGAIESLRDISRLKEAEAELARFNANLEKMIQERTQALHDEIVQRKSAEQDVQDALSYTRSVIEANPDLMAVINRQGVILDVNTATESLTGLPREQLIGTLYSRYLMDNSTPSDIFARLLNEIRIEYTVNLQRTDGHVTPLSVNATMFRGKDEADVRIIVAAHDITRQKQDEAAIQAALDEKVLLLREIHHRVKNNLQIIISLTNLQMRQTDDPGVKQIMSETQNRVRAMALVHEKLYQSESLSRIDFADYTRFLATQLFSNYGMDTRRVRLEFSISEIMLDINTAVPLGLLMNELLSNALKHAFPHGKEGTIGISGTDSGGFITLVIRDDGIGIPADLDWKNTTSLGMRLVTSLIDQVDGTIELDRSGGTAFTLTVRRKPVPGKAG